MNVEILLEEATMSSSANDGGLAPPTDESGLAKYADKGAHNESDDGLIGPDQTRFRE
jgi:hypothetical protein